ncbi:hypothetical protein GCM10007036_15120 [Alsobacter metallidurans]|uniref:Uncharacterized protein n=2 Tax=Alsobacter metallidurans TaxID=340221 RepID=A0A917I6D7_9HYPH|nr:hypothetical protein GCM10007036_15120 [Alsobacter metallidurans]
MARDYRKACARLCMALAIAGGLAGDAWAANPQRDLLKRLNGRWTGGEIYLLIDFERMQGNMDKERPFSRAPLQIRSVAGNMVVFAIGPEQLVGYLERDKLSVSRPGYPPVELRRLK